MIRRTQLKVLAQHVAARSLFVLSTTAVIYVTARGDRAWNLSSFASDLMFPPPMPLRLQKTGFVAHLSPFTSSGFAVTWLKQLGDRRKNTDPAMITSVFNTDECMAVVAGEAIGTPPFLRCCASRGWGIAAAWPCFRGPTAPDRALKLRFMTALPLDSKPTGALSGACPSRTDTYPTSASLFNAPALSALFVEDLVAPKSYTEFDSDLVTMAMSFHLVGGACTEVAPPQAAVRVSAWALGSYERVDSLAARFVNETEAKIFVAVNGKVRAPARVRASSDDGGSRPASVALIALTWQAKQAARLVQSVLDMDPATGQYAGKLFEDGTESHSDPGPPLSPSTVVRLPTLHR